MIVSDVDIPLHLKTGSYVNFIKMTSVSSLNVFSDILQYVYWFSPPTNGWSV